MLKNQKFQNCLILAVFAFIAFFTRFFCLNWGSGFYFHPDEHNIAASVSQLKYPFNPHFFAYGAFPIYIYYFFGKILSFFYKKNMTGFYESIYVGRIVSAFVSVLVIAAVYILTEKLCEVFRKDKKTATQIALLLTIFNAGLIQFAHFSTFETLLTFFYLMTTYYSIMIYKRGDKKDYLLTSIFIAMAVATKIVSLFLIPVFILSHFMRTNRSKNNFIMALSLILIFSFLLSPYTILDFNEFKASMTYEGGVARGTWPVFYTQCFIRTVPFLFQIHKVFPYLMGIGLTFFSFIGLFIYCLLSFRLLFKKKRGVNENEKLNISTIFLYIPVAYFLFNLTFYVKWTRYMVPMIPYLIIISTVFFLGAFNLLSKQSNKVYAKAFAVVVILIFLESILWAMAFFNIYFKLDPRIGAMNYLQTNLGKHKLCFIEERDPGGLITSQFGDNAITINFYELDYDFRDKNEDKSTKRIKDNVLELAASLEACDYILLLSERVYSTRLRLMDVFPSGARFYTLLFSEKLGFKKTAEFRRMPGFGKLLIDDRNSEETFRVFDHPRVIIFEKVKDIKQCEYFDLLYGIEG